MSVSPAAPAPGAPPALSAFLRGVERRGAVLAELQAGDAAAGDAALVGAMRRFRDEARDTPMAVWPQRFWALLLAQPQLQHRTAVAVAIEATDRLGELGSGPRAALLLRVAAGLSEEEAAAVLAVGLPSYRLALQRALPHHADGRADPLAWQQIREQIHRRIKTLPPDRLVRLSSAREAVLRGDGEPTQAARAPTASARPRWLLPLLWTLLALCLLGLAATFWPWGTGFEGTAAHGPVRVEPLPEADSPASRYGEELARVTHRDFALLADPQGEAAAKDLEFHSWLAAQQAAGINVPTPPADAPVEENVAPSPVEHGIVSETEAETADAP
ncbi:hypothetical protein JI752_012375 [Lysobacter sp. MMG2]|uniref:hypothetical protein n=1 Tax=Lysobacter sp. MMG2 TaxID=2801338 RepID=UPI001C2450F9|nr:hypothetical protein [Lysobacter sp. MMG2]MBU8976940.1 hypothetical protein [Lysobacter sp. MMG2]